MSAILEKNEQLHYYFEKMLECKKNSTLALCDEAVQFCTLSLERVNRIQISQF
jgi:hypothetical protein